MYISLFAYDVMIGYPGANTNTRLLDVIRPNLHI